MIYAALITLREGVEVALILAIVLGYLARIGQSESKRVVFLGAGMALVLSVVGATVLELLALKLPHSVQETIEGLGMLIAVGVLTWMLLWMRRQAVTLGAHLRSKVDEAIRQQSGIALGLLAFTSVGREGLETVLFLYAGAGRSSGALLYWLGAAIGLAIAAILGCLLYSGAARLPLKQFFDFSGAFLILLAAGLLIGAMAALREAGFMVPLGPRIWDSYEILPDNLGAGALLAAVFGYTASPFLGQALVYGAYLVFGLTFFFAGRPRTHTQPKAMVPGSQP